MFLWIMRILLRGKVRMAKLVVVAVRDRAVDAFMNPFVVPSVGMAMRSFSDECNAKDSPMNKHPADYELHHLGFFDQESGEFLPNNDRKMLAVASNMIVPKKE